MILIAIVGFLGGCIAIVIVIRTINYRVTRFRQLGEPEMMWFNNEKSQWERVTEMQLLVNDRVIVTVPVKLVKKEKE